ncbi:hypothetical protein [Alistipes putredinis]|uniref:hypothetical protein n=1 Tax=Alistipes putredinis TaxID=28117 RepID=UPI003AB88DC6
MTLKEAIRVLAMSGAELYCKICTVDAVDVEARTVDCTPIDESAPLVGVNLQASQDSSVGIVQFPAAGSYVVVAFIDPAVAVVVLCDEIDKVQLDIGRTSATVTDEGVTLNGGRLGGLVISGKTAEKLNALENDINELKAVLTAWVPVATDGGAALKTAAAAWASRQLAPTAAPDLENDKVKH